MCRFIRVVSIVFIFTSAGLSSAWPKENKVMDMDGDGYKEAEVFYSGNEIAKTLIDTDHDRYVETAIYYKNNHREHAEQDMNKDGKTDRWIYYYFTGAPWKIAEDSNGDGNPDRWYYLKYRRIYRYEEDRNGDGIVDISTIYQVDKKDKTRTLVQQLFDNDFDGVFESSSGMTVADKEAAIPESISEALLR